MFIGNIYGPHLHDGYAGAVFDIKGYSPALTTMTGGGRQPMILITNKIIQIGNLIEEASFHNPQTGRVYDPEGLAPTLNTCGGGQREPKVIINEKKRIRQATKQGYIEMEFGGVVDLNQPNIKT